MKKAVAYIYNSFKDPLFQSNMYLYLLDAAKELDYAFVLITYEQPDHTISDDEKEKLKNELNEKNIKWIPLKWHSGKFKLFKKIWDVLCGLFVILKYRARGYNRIVSLGTVSGSFAYIYSKMFGLKHYLYQYEPHSEFLKDVGVWRSNSISFRLLNLLEKKSGLNTEVIATGTKYMLERLSKMNSQASTFRIPSCVDDSLFEFSEKDRSGIRKNLGIIDRKVLVYAGKFGGIYYDKEVFNLCATIHRKDTSFYFMILSGNDHDEIKNEFLKRGLTENDFYVSQVSHNQMFKYLSASDIGLVSVPPLPSQKFRSPIKVGEYLCCGLPYIVCKGISEDDVYATKYKVGIVLDDFEKASVDSKFVEILKILSEDKVSLRNRCRKVGLDYRGFENLRSVSLSAFRDL